MTLVLKINDRFRNRKVEFFNNFQLNLKYDSVGSTFSFLFYFDPDNPEHKELACVTHFHEVTVEFNKKRILKGVITSQKFSHTPKKELSSFGGYSLPGILEDCTIPPSQYPLQSDGLTLNQIAQKVISPFRRNYGLEMTVDPAVSSRMNKVLSSSTAGETEKIKEYLSKLAKQLNIIVSHDADGRLLFTEAKTKAESVLDFDGRKGMMPGTSFSVDYNGQAMHSHIHVQKQASSEGGNAGSEVIRNPYVIGSVYRPVVINQSSGDDNDTISAARRALGNELANLKFSINTDRWLLPNGDMLTPNTIITIYDPEIYVYKRVRLFVTGVSYTGDHEKTTAKIDAVLPEVYNGDSVSSIYQNINEHALEE